MIAFNKLSYAEAERLYLLAEEMGEAVQAIGKILRHGYSSTHPEDSEGATNRERLMAELGDVQASIQLLIGAGDVNISIINAHSRGKLERVKKYLHHQEES